MTIRVNSVLFCTDREAQKPTITMRFEMGHQSYKRIFYIRIALKRFGENLEAAKSFLQLISLAAFRPDQIAVESICELNVRWLADERNAKNAAELFNVFVD